MVFALGAALAVIFGLLLPDIPPRDRGMVVMISLTVCAFVFSLFTGIALTADCISREKREGTLGLLFLTPLNGGQIVLGKMATHSLQVAYALLGAFPLFFIPLLMGGVVWAEALRVLLVLLVTFSISLACGILWSTFVIEARTSVTATAISMVLLALLPWLIPFVNIFGANRAPDFAGLPQLSPLTTLVFAFEHNFTANSGSLWGRSSGLFVYWGSIACGLLISIGLMTASCVALPHRWREHARDTRRDRPRKPDNPPAATRSGGLAIRKQRFMASLVDWLSWLLSRRHRDPAWSKILRFVVVVFFAIVLSLSVSTRHWEEGFVAAFCTALALHELTRLQFVLTATGPWVEDRRNGALEALLATPITDREFIRIHHQTLRRSFRGPWWILLGLNAALQISVIAAYDHLHMDHGVAAIFSVWFTGGALLTISDFATLRWLSLREALRRPTHLRAAGHSFLRLNAIAWPAFAVTLLIAFQFNEEEIVATLFAAWVILCLILNTITIRSVKRWLKRGLRQQVSLG